nr:hypothetical protein [Chitinophagaceae bacterium]
MAQQRSEHLKNLLGEIIGLHTSEGFEWLKEKTHSPAQFHSTFIATPRKTGKKIIHPGEAIQKEIASVCPGIRIDGWPVDRLARVWL